MAISLTSEGLHLEPTYYWNGESGVNYGVPRLIENKSVSLSGTWSGLTIYVTTNSNLIGKQIAGVSQSVVGTSEWFSSSFKGGGIYFRTA